MKPFLYSYHHAMEAAGALRFMPVIGADAEMLAKRHSLTLDGEVMGKIPVRSGFGWLAKLTCWIVNALKRRHQNATNTGT